MPEPRTHYQLSFTARQAMAFFVVCLLALGLSYFFGLMTGLSGRSGPKAATPSPAASPSPVRAAAATAPEGPFDAAEAGSRTRLASELTPPPDRPAPEGTPPSEIRTFEDGGGEEPTAGAAGATPAPSGVRTPTPAPAVAHAGDELWVQVASLASAVDADALVRRLRHRGYQARIFPTAASPKGRVYRVRTGPYRSEEEASRAADKLKRQEKIRQTWVVREGR